MIINDKVLQSLVKEKFGEKYTDRPVIQTILFENKELGSFRIKGKLCEYLEFLSLQNNFIKDITFLKNLINLFYLDISLNPIENYEILNTRNSFGFLSLSIPSERYMEKNILAIKRLNVGILKLRMSDENLKREFLQSNQNIIQFNDKIVYYHERLGNPGISDTHFKQSVKNLVIGKAKMSVVEGKGDFSSLGQSFNEFEKNTNAKLRHSVSSMNTNKILVLTTVKCQSANMHVNSLTDFLEDHSKEISKILSNKDCESSSMCLKDSAEYHRLERTRLLQLLEIYNRILILCEKNSHYLSFSKDSVSVAMYPFVNFATFKLTDISLQIVVLTVLVLFIIQLINKEFAHAVLKYVFKNYFTNQNESTASSIVQRLLDMDLLYLIALYYDIYSHLLELCTREEMENNKSNYKNIAECGKNLKYQEVIHSLELTQISYQCNSLKAHMRDTMKLFSQDSDYKKRKKLIDDLLIQYLNQLKIFTDIVNIILFLGDFIYYNKVDAMLIKEHPRNYLIFLEIREHMFAYMGKKDQNNLYSTLSYRKYTENKLLGLGNKFYFTNNPIKTKKKKEELGFLDNLPKSKKSFNKENKFSTMEADCSKKLSEEKKKLSLHLSILNKGNGNLQYPRRRMNIKNLNDSLCKYQCNVSNIKNLNATASFEEENYYGKSSTQIDESNNSEIRMKKKKNGYICGSLKYLPVLKKLCQNEINTNTNTNSNKLLENSSSNETRGAYAQYLITYEGIMNQKRHKNHTIFPREASINCISYKSLSLKSNWKKKIFNLDVNTLQNTNSHLTSRNQCCTDRPKAFQFYNPFK